MKKFLMLIAFFYSFKTSAQEEYFSEPVVNSPIVQSEERLGALEKLQSQLLAQMQKLMSLFEQTTKEIQSEKKEFSQAQADAARKKEQNIIMLQNDSEKHADVEKITRSMAYEALAVRENANLSEPTGGDVQSVISAVKYPPLQGKLTSSTNSSQNALIVSGDAVLKTGEATRLLIERNLVSSFSVYGVLNNMPENEKKGFRSLNLNGGRIFYTGDFHPAEIDGYTAYVANFDDLTCIVMFLSPHLILRLETEGKNNAERAFSFFNDIDLAVVKRAMKVKGVLPSIDKIRKQFDEALRTQEGRNIVREYFGENYVF